MRNAPPRNGRGVWVHDSVSSSWLPSEAGSRLLIRYQHAGAEICLRLVAVDGQVLADFGAVVMQRMGQCHQLKVS